MADRPIPFSEPMIRALLAGRKSQTRRLLRKPSLADAMGIPTTKYEVGDRLWVREAWRTYSRFDMCAPRDLPEGLYVWHEADDGYKPKSRFRQGMHMPRWASRLTLTVSDVRVQRVQDISDADAIAEGIDPTHIPGEPWRNYQPGRYLANWAVPSNSYMTLWDSLNADRGFPWDSNPWVVALTFSVTLGNIDELAGTP